MNPIDGWLALGLLLFTYAVGLWAGRGWRATRTEVDLELAQREIRVLSTALHEARGRHGD